MVDGVLSKLLSTHVGVLFILTVSGNLIFLSSSLRISDAGKPS